MKTDQIESVEQIPGARSFSIRTNLTEYHRRSKNSTISCGNLSKRTRTRARTWKWISTVHRTSQLIHQARQLYMEPFTSREHDTLTNWYSRHLIQSVYLPISPTSSYSVIETLRTQSPSVFTKKSLNTDKQPLFPAAFVLSTRTLTLA